jgi:hypothetical protein
MEYDKLPYFDCVFLLQAYQARLKEGADEVNEQAFLKHGIKSCQERMEAIRNQLKNDQGEFPGL